MNQTFSLKKNETFDLKKPELIKELTLGLGWTNKAGHSTDLDLSALFFDGRGRLIDVVNFEVKQRWLLGDAVFHYGDDRTGRNAQTDTDNEQITIRLEKLPANIEHIFAVASLFDGSMKNIQDCYACVRENRTGAKQVNAEMGEGDTGMVLAQFTRGTGEWKMKNHSLPSRGKYGRDFENACQRLMGIEFGVVPGNTRPAAPRPQSAPAPQVRGGTLMDYLKLFFRRLFG